MLTLPLQISLLSITIFILIILLLVFVEITRDNLESLKANVSSFFKKCRVELFAIVHRLSPQFLEMLLIYEPIIYNFSCPVILLPAKKSVVWFLLR